jgi:hypothetical protein
MNRFRGRPAELAVGDGGSTADSQFGPIRHTSWIRVVFLFAQRGNQRSMDRSARQRSPVNDASLDCLGVRRSRDGNHRRSAPLPGQPSRNDVAAQRDRGAWVFEPVPKRSSHHAGRLPPRIGHEASRRHRRSRRRTVQQRGRWIQRSERRSAAHSSAANSTSTGRLPPLIARPFDLKKTKNLGP